MADQTPDFENLEPKIEIDSSKCFICLNDSHSTQDKCDSVYLKRKAKERDKKKCGVKIVTSYILQNSFPSSKENQGREELQTSILNSFSEENLSICSECLSKAENLVELHLELEKIRMQILDVLKSLQDYLNSSLRSHEEVGVQDDSVVSRFQKILLQEFLYRELSNELQVRLTTSTTTAGNYGSTTSCNTPSNETDLDSVGVDPLETCDIDIDTEVKEDEDSDVDDDNDEEYKPEVDLVDEVEEDDIVDNDSGNEDYNFVKDEASSSDPDNDDDIGESEENRPSRNKPEVAVDADENEDKDDLDLVCSENMDYHSLDDEASFPDRDDGHDTQNINEDKDNCEMVVKSIQSLSKEVTDKQLQPQTILWDCDICLENIPSSEMQSHLKTHPEFEKYYICDLCPASSSRSQFSKRVYGTYKGLIWHYLRAYHVMQVPCILCPDQEQKTLFGREGLCRHLYEIHHPSHRKLQCTKESCSAEFYDPDSQRHHIKREHQDLNSNSNSSNRKEKMKCPHCLKLMSKKHLPEHIKHLHVLKRKGGWRTKTEEKKTTATETILNCHICNQVFSRQQGLISHINHFHPETLLSCASCPKKFTTKMSLKVHQLAYHQESEDPVNCLEGNCSETFANKKLLRKHIRIVHEKRPLLQCQFCPKSFLQQRNLKSHEEKHHKMYKCTEPNCSYSGASWRNLRDHQKNIHEKKNKKMTVQVQKFQCPKCPFVTTTSQYLRLHESIHLEKTIPCKECDKLFATKEQLKAHETIHLRDSNPDPMECPTCGKIFNGSKLLQKHIRGFHEKKWKSRQELRCSECPFVTSSSSHLKLHEDGIHKERRIPCQYPNCHKLFSTQETLKFHEKLHRRNLEPDPVQCSTCGKVFTREQNLQRHIQNVHEKKMPVPIPVNRKTYKCTESGCPYEGKSHAALLVHRRVHQDKNLTCQHCSKAFKSEINLEIHERSHTQEKSFICQVEGCEEAFISRFLRTLHEKKKHDYPPCRDVEVDGRQEKLYVCDLCPNNFKNAVNLRLHIKNVHGKQEFLKCPQCPKILKKNCLTGHIRKVHEQVFSCQHCSETFSRKIQLKYHEKIHEESLMSF